MPKLMVHYALFVFLLMFFTNVAHVQPLPPLRYAVPGETARGEAIRDQGTEIHIKTRPCQTTSNVVVFRQPYAKEHAGTVQCGAVNKSLVQVVQR
jgi:hypothetical protein